jgi:MoxR-like ATPase
MAELVLKDYEEICNEFNSLHGTSYNPKEPKVAKTIGLICQDERKNKRTYAKETFLKMIKHYDTIDDISKLFSVDNIQEYLNSEAAKPQPKKTTRRKKNITSKEIAKSVPTNPVDMSGMEAVVNSFNLIEQTMASLLADKFAPQVADEVRESIDKYIKENYGKIERKITYTVQEHGTLDEVTHEQFETVLQIVLADEPVMLVGPAGTGKNVICQQVAKAMNLPFYFSNAVTQEYKLTGFTDANGTYHESQFYKAFTQGGLFMLDEIDASIPEVLVVLNAAIANRYFDFPAPIGKVEAHKDFRIIAGANTFGTGSSYTYSGRYQLDGASLDRFAVVEIGYSPRIEKSITQDNDLLTFFTEYRKAVAKCGINCIVSYRALTRMEKLKNVIKPVELIKMSLTKGLQKDDIRMISKEIRTSNTWKSAFNELAS